MHNVLQSNENLKLVIFAIRLRSNGKGKRNIGTKR